jgi:Fungal specific transcription factor domain
MAGIDEDVGPADHELTFDTYRERANSDSETEEKSAISSSSTVRYDPDTFLREPLGLTIDPKATICHTTSAFDILEDYFNSRVSTISDFDIRGYSREKSSCKQAVDVSFIPRSPKPNSDNKLQWFLSFHQHYIVPGHYFWYFDYYQFCTKWLFEMAKESVPLQYAMAAFSSLVYSIQINQEARPYAFMYYSEALQQLQYQLNNISGCSKEEHFGVLATSLQLASLEVFTMIHIQNSDSSVSLLIQQSAFVMFAALR